MDVSLSHRGAWLACAIAEKAQVGIDIEIGVKPLSPAAWDTFLHPSERRTLEALPQAQQAQAALLAWCRKEAWLKASGFVEKVSMTELAFSSDGCLTTAPAEYVENPRDWHSAIWQIVANVWVALAYHSDEPL